LLRLDGLGVNPGAAATIEPRDARVVTDAPELIRLDDVHLAFGDRPVFRGLSCGCERGRISVFMGGSGAGKSTLLRLVGGLQRPDRGSVSVAGEELTLLSESALFRVRKRIGMLFQGGALLDSLSVFDNVALPLREHTGLREEEVEVEVAKRLAAVGLPETEELRPRQLSGGMLRRAALARAIVGDPEIVLCDEPFSGLDPLNVRRIERLLGELRTRLGLTLLVTSHHVPSSLRMADRIVFLVDGEAIAGTPEELLRSEDKRVREFLEAELVVGAETAGPP
jgi:phospholipid/cholesterol/gamma-HCH transport system ATP-binding protein